MLAFRLPTVFNTEGVFILFCPRKYAKFHESFMAEIIYKDEAYKIIGAFYAK